MDSGAAHVVAKREVREVAAAVRGMSLAEKVGQLFVVPIGRHSPNALRLPPDQRTGTELADDGLGRVADQLRAHHVGGVCYFPTRPDGDDAADVAALLAELDRVTDAARVRPILAVDQEGGTVARLRRGVTSVPGAMALAATGDPDNAGRIAAIIGAELRAIGFHQDYAPDADVNSNPANPVIGVRSFGADPASVARHVAAAVRGLRGAGIAATAKHFPGHGDTATDSHLALPAVDRSRGNWEATDLVPFTAAIGAGVDAVMSAHVAVPSVDGSGAPATASPAILTGVLRDHLGFRGVVVTDAMDMAGARTEGDGEAVVRALAAGADQLLMPADLEVAVAAVRSAVESARIPMARLDEAVGRILALKHRYGLLTGAPAPPAPGQPDRAGHARTARDLARRAVTVLGAADLRPPAGRAVALVGYLDGLQDDLLPVLAQGGTEVTVVDTGSDPDASRREAAVSAAADAWLTVVVSRSAARWEGQRLLLRALGEGGHRHALLALKEPYDAGLAPRAVSRVLTYGDNQVMRAALVDVLSGTARPGGRLPVDVPGPDGTIVYHRGAGA